MKEGAWRGGEGYALFLHSHSNGTGLGSKKKRQQKIKWREGSDPGKFREGVDLLGYHDVFRRYSVHHVGSSPVYNLNTSF